MTTDTCDDHARLETTASLASHKLVLSSKIMMRLDNHGATVLCLETKNLFFYNLSAARLLYSARQPIFIQQLLNTAKWSAKPNSANLHDFIQSCIGNNILVTAVTPTSPAQLFDCRARTMPDLPFAVPLGAELELTLRCLRKCEYCAYGSSPTVSESGNMSREQLLEVINHLADIGVFYIRFSGGDPFLHPHLLECVSAANRAGMQITVASDFTRHDPHILHSLSRVENLLTLKTTLDGSTADRADKLRGNGNFKRVTDTIRYCHENDISLPISVGMIISKFNYDDVYATAKLLHSLGTHHFSCSPLYISGRMTDTSILPTEEQMLEAAAQYDRARKDGLIKPLDSDTDTYSKTDMRFLIDGNLPEKRFVRAPESRIRIDASGRVYSSIKAANILGDEAYIGSALDKNLPDLWINSDHLNRLRSHSISLPTLGRVASLAKGDIYG